MIWIDPNGLELCLPEEWFERASAALDRVQVAMEDARSTAVANGLTAENVEKEVRSARSKAIGRHSNVWSEAGKYAGKLSSGKCWYCETRETRSDMPVDHFRPKNRVAHVPEHQGYWWLAFDHANYRYSCTFCNSRRVADATEGGKQDAFPLVDEARRQFDPPGTGDERPIRLDPCDPMDVQLLTYSGLGKATPAAKPGTLDHKRAQRSIELYHLDHNKAADERKGLAIVVRDKVREMDDLEQKLEVLRRRRGRIERAIAERSPEGEERDPDLDRQLDELGQQIDDVNGRKREPLKELLRRLAPGAEYQSAARAFLRGHRGMNRRWLDELV
ncbi:MAG: hypothetical protein AAFZ87_03010 [Planctomycetota bacterium]